MLAEPQTHLVAPKKAIRDPDFANRLNQVCDEHPDAPALHYGRLGWMRQQLSERFDQSVSAETVRRWLSGETTPRREKMRDLASLFGVNVAWLSLGVGSADRQSSTVSTSGDRVQGAPPGGRPSKGANWLDQLRKELAGTVTIPPGVDITAPTGEVWDAEL